jgi:hypothetical protein
MSWSRGRQRRGWEDVVYSVAFAFHAFYPASEIVTD